MKNNTLVLIDWLVGILIFPTIISVLALKKAISLFYFTNGNGRLIIKFLGAGNYVAMSKIIDQDTVLISAISNKAAIERFIRPKTCFYIDDSSFHSLLLSSICAIFFILRKNFHEVINLEAESSFSKLLTSLARADYKFGVTNKHRSYLDAFMYDKYLVNPVMLGKSEIVNLLTNFSLVTNYYCLASIRESQKRFLRVFRKDKRVQNVVFAPSGSDTNNLRRVNVGVWKRVADKFFDGNDGLTLSIIFPNAKDQQYESFNQVFSQSIRCSMKIGSYEDYVDTLTEADLIVCIDSQSLHLGSKLQVPVICFFGPTSPYGVGHSDNVFPISKAPACSPCMHKYFCPPCDNIAVCMDFNEDDLKIFDQLLTHDISSL